MKIKYETGGLLCLVASSVVVIVTLFASCAPPMAVQHVVRKLLQKPYCEWSSDYYLKYLQWRKLLKLCLKLIKVFVKHKN